MNEATLQSLKRRCTKTPGDERDYAIPVAEVRELLEEVTRLHVVLGVIYRWELPETGMVWESADGRKPGMPMTYEAAFGSHGAKEYIRKIARDAIQGG